MNKKDTLKDLLDSRGSDYGSFSRLARRAQIIKSTTRGSTIDRSPEHLVHLEAFEMIATKLARITAGDPDILDNWVDIAGYATLVADHIRNKDKE
jgi:hypothetical protein